MTKSNGTNPPTCEQSLWTFPHPEIAGSGTPTPYWVKTSQPVFNERRFKMSNLKLDLQKKIHKWKIASHRHEYSKDHIKKQTLDPEELWWKKRKPSVPRKIQQKIERCSMQAVKRNPRLSFNCKAALSPYEGIQDENVGKSKQTMKSRNYKSNKL